MSTIAHEDGRKRCSWPGTDPLYIAYHDTDWGVPERDSRALFEKLLLDGFQAGLSWITILRKRENFRRAFDGFEPQRVARYGERKVAALMQDAGIVRNRAKIEGAILRPAPISSLQRCRNSRNSSGTSSMASRCRMPGGSAAKSLSRPRPRAASKSKPRADSLANAGLIRKGCLIWLFGRRTKQPNMMFANILTSLHAIADSICNIVAKLSFYRDCLFNARFYKFRGAQFHRFFK